MSQNTLHIARRIPIVSMWGETLQDYFIKAGGCWEWQSPKGPRKRSSCGKGRNLFRQSPFCPCDASKLLPASCVPWLSSMRRASLCHSSKQHLEGKEAALHWPAAQQVIRPCPDDLAAADCFKKASWHATCCRWEKEIRLTAVLPMKYNCVCAYLILNSEELKTDLL